MYILHTWFSVCNLPMVSSFLMASSASSLEARLITVIISFMRSSCWMINAFFSSIVWKSIYTRKRAIHFKIQKKKNCWPYLGRKISHESVRFCLRYQIRNLRPVLAHDHLERGLMFGDHRSEYSILANDLLQLPALGAYRVDKLFVGQTSFFHVVQLGQIVRVLRMKQYTQTTTLFIKYLLHSVRPTDVQQQNHSLVSSHRFSCRRTGPATATRLPLCRVL